MCFARRSGRNGSRSMSARGERLYEALARRRVAGVRKRYNGRRETERYDSRAPSLVEVGNRPMRVWTDGARDASSVADGAALVKAKIPGRPQAPFQRDMQFADKEGDKRVYTVEVLEVAYARRGEAGGARAVIRLIEPVSGDYVSLVTS